MANQSSKSAAANPGSSTSTLAPPEQVKPKQLPPYKVILHNDDKNDFEHVIETVVLLCGLKKQDAELRAAEAHVEGCSLLLVTHKERAELYLEQFQSRSLTVTIEPAE